MIEEDHVKLKEFAQSLGNHIVDEAKKVLESHGLTEHMFSVGVKLDPPSFQIRIACNEYIYLVPEISIFSEFKGPDYSKSLNDFIESYGRFMAYDYLNFCEIPDNTTVEQDEKEE